jgi:N-acetylneuraminic acid mutarotase
MLEPNAGAWSELLPHVGHPFTSTSGTGALIKGTIYSVNYVNNVGSYMKLGPGSRSWEEFTNMEADGKGVTPASFYATLNGVGKKEDGFYIFSRSASAVYKPNEGQWTYLPMHSDSDARSNGATVAIKNLIYLLGGAIGGSTVSENVDVFDASTGKFSGGVAMLSARKDHGAATYGGKIFVFGGSDARGRLIDTVEMFDPAAAQWSAKTKAPMQMSGMSTGQLPVFANGEVLIPYTYRNDRTTENSLKYDAVYGARVWTRFCTQRVLLDPTIASLKLSHV